MSPAETQTPATSHQTMASNIINSTVAAVLNVTNNIEREMDITTTHAQIGMFIDKIFTGFQYEVKHIRSEEAVGLNYFINHLHAIYLIDLMIRSV